MNIRHFYKTFVGNPDCHIIWDEKNNRWKRSFLKITRNLLLKHFKKEIAIGSYPIYQNGGTNYCRWGCIDIDSHAVGEDDKIEDNKIDEEIKQKQENYARYLYSNSHIYLDVPKSCLLLEDSVGGYHIWIIFKNKTLLSDVGKYVYKIKETLDMLAETFYDGEMPEFYPKQYTTKHLEKELGNAVRLPLGRNIGKKGDCKILLGDINNLKPIDLKPIVKGISIEDINNIKEFTKDYGEPKKYDGKEIPQSLHFWMEFPIRPCFKRIISKETQPHGAGGRGHRIRMGLVHECNYYGMPFEAIVDCFRNQPDFNEKKTRDGIKSVIKYSDDWRYSCEKIAELGYCYSGCEKNEYRNKI